LPAPAVVAALDPGDDRRPQLLASGPALPVEHVLLQQREKDSIAALSPQAPTRPIEPTRPLLTRVRTKAFERNWLPRSEWTTVPTGLRQAIALLSAATVSEPGLRRPQSQAGAFRDRKC
jgi:hypothetical protein